MDLGRSVLGAMSSAFPLFFSFMFLVTLIFFALAIYGFVYALRLIKRSPSPASTHTFKIILYATSGTYIVISSVAIALTGLFLISFTYFNDLVITNFVGIGILVALRLMIRY
jgi:hypothetical protein